MDAELSAVERGIDIVELFSLVGVHDEMKRRLDAPTIRRRIRFRRLAMTGATIVSSFGFFRRILLFYRVCRG